MNVVDYVILGILGVSLLFGLYRGFVSSVLNTGGCLISFGLSFVLYPRVVEWVSGNAEIQRWLLNFTDATSRVGDLEVSVQNAGSLTAQTIADVVSKVNLPEPLSTLLRDNLTRHVYGASATISSYVSQTILGAFMNILSFLVCFAVLYLALSILGGVLRAVFRFPVLKQLDALAGGIFGLLRGALICYALFALIPLVQTVVQMEPVNELIAQSQLAGIFNNGAMITAILNRRL